MHIKRILIELRTKLEAVELHIDHNLGLGVGDLHLFWFIGLFGQPYFLAHQCAALVICRDFKHIVVSIHRKLPVVVRDNAVEQCLVQIYLTLAIRPIALEAEAFAQTRCQHEHPFIIAQNNLRYILLHIGEANPVVGRIFVPDLHLVLLRLFAGVQGHRAGTLVGPLLALQLVRHIVQILDYGSGILLPHPASTRATLIMIASTHVIRRMTSSP